MICSRKNLGVKLLSIFVVCLFVMCTFAAAIASEKVTLRFFSDAGFFGDKLMTQIFEVCYPNIKVNLDQVPFAQFFDTIEARLAKGGETPDVYAVDSPLNTSYAVRGFTMPLDEYLAKYPELANLQDYIPASLKAMTYKGKHYSLPRDTSSQFMYYNKDIFSKYGIQFPERLIEKRWTWEEVVEVAKKLTIDEDGDGDIDIWGFAFEQVDRPYTLLSLAQSLGETMIGPDQLTATGYVDSPKSIRAGQFYFDLFNTWKVSPIGIAAFETDDVFGAGKIAMLLAGNWLIERWKRHYPNLNWDVTPFPYFKGGTVATPTGAWNIGVNPNSKHKDEAADFAIHMTSRSMAVIHYELMSGLPARKSVYKLFEDRFAEHPWSIVTYESTNTAVPRPITPGYLEWELIMMRAYSDMRTGVKPEEALSRAAKEIDQQLRKYAPLMK